MRIKSSYSLLFIVCILFLASYSSGIEKSENNTETQENNTNVTEEKENKSPSAFLIKKRYEFEKVVEGTSVVHDFIIENKGLAPLLIQKVSTG